MKYELFILATGTVMASATWLAAITALLRSQNDCSRHPSSGVGRRPEDDD